LIAGAKAGRCAGTTSLHTQHPVERVELYSRVWLRLKQMQENRWQSKRDRKREKREQPSVQRSPPIGLFALS
jgi:hypothetical protein